MLREPEHPSLHYRLATIGISAMAAITACTQRVRPPIEYHLNSQNPERGTVVVNDGNNNLGDVVNGFIANGLTSAESASTCLTDLSQELDPYLDQRYQAEPWKQTFVVTPHVIDYKILPESCRSSYDAVVAQALQPTPIPTPLPTSTPTAIEHQVKETLDTSSDWLNYVKSYLTAENITGWLQYGIIGHTLHIIRNGINQLYIKQRRNSGYGIDFDRTVDDIESWETFKKVALSLKNVVLGPVTMCREMLLLTGKGVSIVNNAYIQSGIRHPIIDKVSKVATKLLN